MRNLLKPLKNKIPHILLIILFLSIQAYCNLALPSYTADIVNIGIQNADVDFILNIGMAMLVMVIISLIATIFTSFLSSRISSGYAKDLRLEVYSRVLKFSNHELNQISKASLITRTTNDINQIQTVITMIFTTLLFAPILGVGSIIKAFGLGTNLSWIILITFLIVALLLILTIVRTLPHFKLIQVIVDRLNRTTREVLMGMPVIKAFVRQDIEREKFDEINSEFLDVTLYAYRNMFLLLPSLTLVMNIMIVLIIYFGAYEALNSSILTGDIIEFIQYSTQIVSSFIMLGGFLMILPRILVSGRRVAEILNIDITIEDGQINQIDEIPTLEFKNISYKYPGSEKATLKDINFKLESGKTTAIIGGIGCGKSTILNLIPRLQDPTSGEILINNQNIKNYTLHALRDTIGFVPQKAILLHGTVKSNMLIGKMDASDEEIRYALDLAQVDFIDSLDDEVAQEATNFSGGQKQRLSIARAILAEHDFYIFDDCFSALDMNTEAKLKKNLSKLSQKASVLIVSQRISTIMDADEILVMDNGEIIDRGTHDELNRSCRIYHEIVKSQIEDMGVGL